MLEYLCLSSQYFGKHMACVCIVVCMSVCIICIWCVHKYVYLCICVQRCQQEGSCLLRSLSTLLPGDRLSHLIGCLQFQWALEIHLSLPSLGVTGTSSHVQLFMWLLRFNFKSLSFQSKCF